jgi:hypothetical protein
MNIIESLVNTENANRNDIRIIIYLLYSTTFKKSNSFLLILVTKNLMNQNNISEKQKKQSYEAWLLLIFL